MSNRTDSLERWSRARLQRQELGPIVHDFGHQIYDEAEAWVEAGGPLAPLTDLASLSNFAISCVHAVEAVDTTMALYSTDGEYETAKSVIPANRGYSIENGNISEYEITHFSDLYNAMSEGLTSGVVIPLQLYRLIMLSGRSDSATPKEPILLDSQDMVKQISSDNFQRMLHQLAVGSNASLGQAAVAIPKQSVYDAQESGVFKVVSRIGLLQSFEHDEDGNVVGWSAELLKSIKDFKAEARNSRFSLERESGGCPVRHTTYPVLGEIAAKHFTEIGAPNGEPRFQGVSLITRASRFVCTALRVSAERAQS